MLANSALGKTILLLNTMMIPKSQSNLMTKMSPAMITWDKVVFRLKH